MKNWKNLCKRGLSLLVCFVMCLSMLPGVAYAKEGDDCRRAGCNGVLVAVPETPATCTEGTIKAHLTCSICGTNYHRGSWSVMYLGPVDRISDPLGHDMTYHAATEATCTIPGNVEYWSCSRCGKNFSDQAGNTEITNPTGTTDPDNHTGEQVREHDDAGHWTEWNCCHVMVGSKEAHTYIGADCVTEGACNVCGAKGIDSNAHVPSEAVRENVVEATCVTEGSYDEVVYCSVCKKELSRETKTDPATGNHEWNDGEVTKAATCTTVGEMTYTCTECGETKTESIPIGEHDWNLDSRTEVEAATCQHPAKYQYTCKNCEATNERYEGSYGSHIKPGTGPEYREFWDGSRKDSHVAKCTVCGQQVFGREPHVWEYGPWEITGINMLRRTGTCSVCGKETTESKGRIKRTEVTPATCIAPETTTYYYDVLIGGGKKEEQHLTLETGPINPDAHTWNDGEVTTPATCTTPGEMTFTCQNNASHTKTEKIEATGHNLYHHAYVAPTCEKDGKEEYWTCITCLKDFGDAEGKTPVDEKDMVIPQLDHNYESKWSWYWDGLHYNATLTLTCKNDNSHTKSDTDANTTPDRKPDCGKEVVITYTAKVVIDGKEYTSTATRTAQPTGEHTPGTAVRENEVAATCAKEGSYDEVVYCTECKAEISRKTKTIEKKAHTPAEAVRENVVDSTCAAEGSYDEVVYCSECEEEISREAKTIEKKAHTPGEAVRENVEDSTCAAEGSYDEVVYCSECNEELSRETKTIEKKAHTYGPWTITVEPTTEAKGEAKHTCTVCGHEETQELPQLPTSENPGDGTWTLSEEAAPTCTEDGRNVYTSEYGTVEVVVPALGHDFAEAWTAGDNSHWHVCTRCEDAIDGAAAHDYDDGEVTLAPTATAEGTRIFTCQTCGATRTEAIPATGTVTPPTPPTPAPAPGTGGGTGGTPTPTPGGDVNIDEEDVPLADITFEDVLPTDPFYEAVKYVFNRGLMEGVSDTEFAPQATLNRAMLVTILYRLEGEPEAEPSTFKDVPAGKWFTDAVGWAAANEVVEGYDDDHFGPLDPLTREQMAAILHRYAKYKGYDVTDAADLTAYTDADAIHEYALDAATWSVAISVLEALTETTLGPRDNATRAQVAVALMNFCEKYVPLETEGEAA